MATPATSTVVIAGDAAATAQHVRAAQGWKGCFDTAAALAALTDMIELADVIIPGHDNVMFTPRRWL